MFTIRNLKRKYEQNLPGPDFLVVGAMRAGTTSLFKYLSFHPQILVPETKELHYFYHGPDGARSREWYESQFPETENTIQDVLANRHKIKGEATPYYSFHPLVPATIWTMYPRVQLIMMLRDPLERAISHYYHDLKWELIDPGVSLEEAFEKDLEITPKEEKKLRANPYYYSYAHQHHSFVSRSAYDIQITRWLQYFPAAQLMVLRCEDLFEKPFETVAMVCDFLGIQKYPEEMRNKLEVYNKVEHDPLSPERKKHLAKYFQKPPFDAYYRFRFT